MFSLQRLHALLQWLLHDPADAALQYRVAKICLLLGHCVISVALEFCLLPNGVLCYFSCKVLINAESRRGSSSVIVDVWYPSFCILNVCSGSVAVIVFQF